MRWLTLPLLIALLTIAAACNEEEEWTSDDAEPADDQAAEVEPTPEPDPTPTAAAEEPTGVEPLIDMSLDRDPGEIMTELAIDPDNPDFELIYSVLPERFQVIEFDEQWMPRITNSLPTTDSLDDIGEFLVDRYDGYAVVRAADIPIQQWVFAREGDEWRYDPGEMTLLRAALYVEHPDGGPGIGLGTGNGPITQWDTNFEPMTPPIVSMSPMATGATADAVSVVTQFRVSPGRDGPGEQFDSHLLEDVTFPLEAMSWSAGGESGDVEITWTNAAMDDEHFILPGWTERELEYMEDLAEDESPSLGPRQFSATFLLSGVPEDAEEVTFEINDVEVGPFGDDAPVTEGEVAYFDFTMTFPNETTDPILIGEPPEPPEALDPDDEPEPVAEDELPDAPGLVDVLELTSIEYGTGDDSVEATVSFDHHDRRIELPGPVTVIWDDDVETEATVMMSGVDMDVTGERDEEPLDAEVVAVRFEQAVWTIGEDEDARFTEDTIETAWGDFQIISIRDNVIQYQPAGQRVIDTFTFEHEDGVIGIIGASTSYDEDLRPQQSSLQANQDIEELVDQLPLPATVTVQGSGSGITVAVGEE